MKLLPDTAPSLREPSTEVPDCLFGNQEFANFIEEMFKTMHANNGIGLACPQIGDNIRMFIMSAGGQRRVCINPKIDTKSVPTSKAKEGCLSFPGLELSVERPDVVKVEYQDFDGNTIVEELDGIAARCFQHELDHLDGIVFTTHVGPTALKLARSKVKKKLKRKKT